MSKYKIVHEREKCISCGACAAVCSDYWSMENDGKSKLKGAKKIGKNFELQLDDFGCIKNAADTCPVNCIHIIETKGNKKLI
jgi:ferredoxin